MILWGIVWFGILGACVIFDIDSFIAYLAIGALAGLHLNAEARKLFSKLHSEALKSAQPQQWSVPSTSTSPSSSAERAQPSPLPQTAQAATDFGIGNLVTDHGASPAVSIPTELTTASTPALPTAASNATTVYAQSELAQSTRVAQYDFERSSTSSIPKAVEPNAVEKLFASAKNWLLGGNTVVRVGIVVLFIGLAFLAKYTAQLGLFPIEARLTTIALVGVALLAFGFLKRTQKHIAQYALTLQGAGVAVLNLTLLAAMKGYGLLPMGMTFALMVLVCALGCALAYLQNSMVLALVSFAGGFAAPILLSTGEGNYIGLFTYYTILNLAILVIAYFKTWRPLNLLGFFATFGVATMWGVLSFKPENYLPAQGFLVLFFVIYLLTAMLYARNTARADTLRQMPLIDNTLIFGTPLVAFGLQIGLVRAFEYGAAFSALGMAAIYVLCAFVLVRQTRGYNKLLLECFLALGVGFLTLAIPLALNGQWIGVAWALEGLGAFWVGMRQARWMPRALGLVLQLVSGLILLASLNPVFVTPFVNTAFLNFALLVACVGMIAFILRRPLPHSNSNWAQKYAVIERQAGAPFYLYGFVAAFIAIASQWFVTGVGNTQTMLDNSAGTPWITSTSLQIILLASTYVLLSAASSFWGHRINAVAHWPSFLIGGVLLLALFALSTLGAPLLSAYGWLFWPLALLLYLVILRRAELGAWMNAAVLHGNHALWVWLAVLVVAQTLYWHVAHSGLVGSAWVNVIYLFTLTVCLIALSLWAGRIKPAQFPLATQQSAYLLTAALPIAVLVLLGALGVALSSSGDTRPLPYIPVLNPTDLSIALGVAALIFWRLKLKQVGFNTPLSHSLTQFSFLPILAVAGFILINTVWLRIAHHYFGVAWSASALFDSYVVQTGYAIIWSLMALVTMVWAHRHAERLVWMFGAGLLGLTVLKLVTIDLANRGGFERIIAFIAVGAMMLVIGYLAPLPPQNKNTTHEKS